MFSVLIKYKIPSLLNIIFNVTIPIISHKISILKDSKNYVIFAMQSS